MNVFVFDIETVPDVEGGRRLYDLDGLDDKEVANIMFHKRRQETGNDFLRLPVQKIVAISVVLRSHDRLAVWSLGEEEASEKEIIERFFTGIDKYIPTIVSWNGKGFDLPVLHYRSLIHGIPAQRYWETGEHDQSFKWNNYLSRYHRRHTDLMDIIAGYENRAIAPLDQIATLLGFPGKMGMSGAKVWDYYQEGKLADIRNYCETDVLNTYLVYLRFQLINGNLNHEEYLQETKLVRSTLKNENKPHFTEFLENWSQEILTQG
ncbi:Polysaccharide biosynthesis protein WlaX [hydrothermal vent metagenome]|uniref:Polysaccharide biosynthesis protein WlaX n=1 Tax=hydrothermal vent metagenome TaxID=652676 RepID=A0A3B1AZN5_9ZZZZ